MLQFDEYKVKLNNLLPQLDDLEQALNLDEAARQVDFLEAQCAADGFWDNPENSQKVLQKLKQEKNKLESQAKRRSSWDDMMVLCEMGNEEEDESLLPELGKNTPPSSRAWSPPGSRPCSPASTTPPT